MWRITYDMVDEMPITKPDPNLSSDNVRPLAYWEEKHFRLLDDDDNVVFIGVSDEADHFEPLDAVGEMHGCTAIEWWDDAKGWQRL